MIRRGALLLLAFVAPATAQTTDLGGEWQAPFTLVAGTQMESVEIRQTGTHFEATKLTGDRYVPAGTMNLRGMVGASPFPAEQICANPATLERIWLPVTVTLLDQDHFKVEGACSGDATWTRMGGPPLS